MFFEVTLFVLFFGIPHVIFAILAKYTHKSLCHHKAL